MRPLTDQEFSMLVGLGACPLHYHEPDPATFNDRLQLSSAQPVTNISTAGTYTVTRADELLLCDTSSGIITIQLPVAASGREFQIVKTVEPNALIIKPETGEAITGSTGLVIYGRYTSLHLKAVVGGYILI